MCGIAGIVGLEKEEAAIKTRKMADALRHRGPDAEGFFVDEDAALCHRRLSIIDLSESANQPLFDPSGRYAIVFNGEIYNFRELRESFTDFDFRTGSDTEVILAAYARHGAGCLSLLNGMFAFAIWDAEKRELFAARDRLGVKPFYYALTDDGRFVFASEIRTILESDLVARRLSESGLCEYLMYQSAYAPQTIVEGISQLAGGEYGIWRGGRFEKKTYWAIEQNDFEEIDADEARILRTTRELLARSIERRMISDVPLGAFLSGGIDSSAVVGLMSEVSEQKVNTFSVVFGEREYDESRYSGLIAERFNTKHTTVRLTPAHFLDELPNALRAMDSPSGDGLNTYVVSKATRANGITVALSGLGGDELFAGYEYFNQWFRLRSAPMASTPAVLRKMIASALALSRSSKYQRAADMLSADNINISGIYPMIRQVISRRAAGAYAHHSALEVPIRSLLAAKEFDIEQFPLLSQFTIAELLGYTQNVLLKDTDQFSMASALEVREPFFDYHLVEYVLRIPDRFKYPKYPKSLLVESLAGLLPDEIVHRKKMGFVLPFEKWMRGELKDFCRSRIRNLAARRIVDADLLLANWNAFERGSKRVRWSELWHLIVLTEWLENNKF